MGVFRAGGVTAPTIGVVTDPGIAVATIDGATVVSTAACEAEQVSANPGSTHFSACGGTVRSVIACGSGRATGARPVGTGCMAVGICEIGVGGETSGVVVPVVWLEMT